MYIVIKNPSVIGQALSAVRRRDSRPCDDRDQDDWDQNTSCRSDETNL